MSLVEQLVSRRADLRLLTAIDAIHGIKLARESQPEVILMDINLPEVSGVDALAILNEDPATTHIPIIALTSNASVRDVEFGIEVGFYRYLTKPVRIKEFMEAVDVALDFAAKRPRNPKTG